MGKKVVIIHTGAVTLQILGQAMTGMAEELEIANIVDDSLLNDALKSGGMTAEVRERLTSYFRIAEGMGADVILNACSSMGEGADYAGERVSVPVVKIDNRMAERAVELGTRIGVLATVATTMEPTVRLIERKALERGKAVEIERRLCPEAFEAVLRGDGARHDELLIGAVRELAGRNEVLVLAQASMARLAPSVADVGVPVLTSPQLGVSELAETLRRL